MSFSWNSPVTSTFVSNGTSQLITIPADTVYFKVFDETQFGLTTADTDMLQAYWFKDMTAGQAWTINRVSGQATDVTTNMITTNGFTFIDPTAAQLQASKTHSGAGTITSAAPAVVTITSHGYLTGDVIRITQTTGLLQIPMDYTITRTGANTFTLTNLDTTLTNLTATATNVVAQKLNYGPAFTPRVQGITNIGSSGLNSIITLPITHNYVVGQSVRIYVPPAFVASGTNPFVSGSVVLPAIPATVVAINATDASGFTNTITVNVNSAGFTFQWPTSAIAAAGTLMPFVEPVGEAAVNSVTQPFGNLLDDRTRNISSFQMFLGSSVVGVTSDVIRWFAYRGLVQ